MDAVIELIQRTARGIFVAITISLLILIHNPDAIWGIPFGVIIGLCSQAVILTKKTATSKKGDAYWKTLWNSESDLAHWEILHDNIEKTVILHYVPEEDYSGKDIKIKLTYEEFEDLTEFIHRISREGNKK